MTEPDSASVQIECVVAKGLNSGKVLTNVAEIVEAQVRESLLQSNTGREPARVAERPITVSADDFNDED